MKHTFTARLDSGCSACLDNYARQDRVFEAEGLDEAEREIRLEMLNDDGELMCTACREAYWAALDDDDAADLEMTYRRYGV